MVTGSTTLNNLSNEQLEEILKAETQHGSKISIDVPQIRQFQPGMTVSGVTVSWNDEEGFRIALTLFSELIAPPKSAEKAQ